MNTRRIVILGFMACGKTTVGEELARQLNCGFVDLDSFITSREGRSPAEIITQDGQAAFRELETLALRDVLQAVEVERVLLLEDRVERLRDHRDALLAPQPHQCLIDDDAVDPGAEGGLPAEARQRAEHPEKHFLRQVERFVPVSWDGDNETSFKVELHIDAHLAEMIPEP